MHESLNFGHEKFPAEDDGYYIGYTPMFNRPPDIKNSKDVNIIFLISSDYKNQNRKAIVGFYGFPMFGKLYKREAKHALYKGYDSGNIKAYPKNIIFFDTPIIINNETAVKNDFLPLGKKISQQGFNYLNSDNVYNLIKAALALNAANQKLKSFVRSFPLLVEVTREINELKSFYEAVGDKNADTVAGIIALEKQMKDKIPEVKERISSYIERGAIANKVKKLTSYRCMVCDALGTPPYSFKKKNGDHYVETHHVTHVAIAQKGVLSISNLITVCANHHRQLHYGETELLQNTNDEFIFKVDNSVIEIPKIKVNEKM